MNVTHIISLVLALTSAKFCQSPNWIFDVESKDNLIFTAEYIYGVGIYNFEDCKVKRVKTSGDAVDVHIDGNTLYVAEGREGLEIYRIEDDGIKFISSFKKERESILSAFTIDNLLLFALGKSGIRVVDRNGKILLSLSTSPFLTTEITVNRKIAYFLTRHRGLYILNLDALSINLIPFSGWCYDICSAEGKAFVACGKEGIKVIGDDGIRSLKISGWVSAIDCNESVLAIGLGPNGILITSTKNPETKRIAFPSEGWVSAVKVSGQRILVGESWRGIRIIDSGN